MPSFFYPILFLLICFVFSGSIERPIKTQPRISFQPEFMHYNSFELSDSCLMKSIYISSVSFAFTRFYNMKAVRVFHFEFQPLRPAIFHHLFSWGET